MTTFKIGITATSNYYDDTIVSDVVNLVVNQHPCNTNSVSF